MRSIKADVDGQTIYFWTFQKSSCLAINTPVKENIKHVIADYGKLRRPSIELMVIHFHKSLKKARTGQIERTRLVQRVNSVLAFNDVDF